VDAQVIPENSQSSISVELHVPEKDVKLWWPNGFGEASLYLLTMQLWHNRQNVLLDSTEKRIGFRTVELVQVRYPLQLLKSSF
jgi:beta-mannosidase